MLRVAIDGPGGTGKSTIAKAIADRFGIQYIDTGAMYRAIALKTIMCDVNQDDEVSISKMLDNTKIDFDNNKAMLDGEDVSDKIRTNEISMRASHVSRYSCVRRKVDNVSKYLASTRNVVMEGRDIGTVVIPDAEIKIFMTAKAEIRARRRVEQLLLAGKEAEYNQVLKEINDRDYLDSNRAINPLRQSEDAVYLDTSNMSVEENIDAVADIITNRTGYQSIKEKR
ncbi:MAG: (d)CMP kinase [Clostridiales bacterium]|nr:(d)CMP kinase [Clostridiales bacterium]